MQGSITQSLHMTNLYWRLKEKNKIKKSGESEERESHRIEDESGPNSELKYSYIYLEKNSKRNNDTKISSPKNKVEQQIPIKSCSIIYV